MFRVGGLELVTIFRVLEFEVWLSVSYTRFRKPVLRLSEGEDLHFVMLLLGLK